MESETKVTRIELSNIGLVLHKPHFSENIGAAARAAKNMGIRRLVVSDPYKCDLTRILRMATHAAEDVVADMEVADTLEDALSPFQYIVGTTARTGSHRQTVRSPRRLARELIPISQNNRVAIVFGPEDRGLTSQDLKYCDSLVTIPTADFKSLNLAQAVMVMAYELHLASTEETTPFIPRLATSRELEGMYDHLQSILTRINFINPENPQYWMQSVRRFCSRIGLRAREVKMIRGACRQLDWYFSRHENQAPAPTTPDTPPRIDIPESLDSS